MFRFQSHYGLILSPVYVPKHEQTPDFQSHYGLILSDEAREFVKDGNFVSAVFQSHYGLILSNSSLEAQRFLSDLLSIPLWSDFIFCSDCIDLFLEHIFQSHYGLILSHR